MLAAGASNATAVVPLFSPLVDGGFQDGGFQGDGPDAMHVVA
jgi:hypothetical protein